MFARNDWVNWSACWRWIGLTTGCHQLLPQLFVTVFGGVQDEDVQEPMFEDAEDPVPPAQAPDAALGEAAPAPQGDPAAVRVIGELGAFEGPDLNEGRARTMTKEDKARIVKQAVAFMSTQWYDEFWIMQMGLRPEVQLMADLLLTTKASRTRLQLQSQAVLGTRSYVILDLHRGVYVDKSLRESSRCLRCAESFSHIAETEVMRSLVLRFTMRSAAHIWFRIKQKLSHYPYKLFTLLEDRSPENAARLLRGLEERCLLDSFLERLLSAFPTVQQLVSEDVRQVLASLAAFAQCNTYETERLHSKNTRRTAARARGHKPDLSYLGLAHQGFAGPQWMKPKSAASAKAGAGRPRKDAQRVLNHGGASGCADSYLAKDRGVKRRRGGGGPWRYFVYTELNGVKFRACDIPALAQRYHSLTPAEKQELVTLGRQGHA